MLLKTIKYQNEQSSTNFPFNLPWLKDLKNFSFNQPITIFVGENGVGKSTLLEMLAYHSHAISLNNQSLESMDEYQWLVPFANSFKLIWEVRTRKGFFFRADDFITFIRETKMRRQDAHDALKEIDLRDPNHQTMERMPHMKTLAEMKALYPTDLEELSHGQSFMALFKARLRPQSLYILDEPETPLSPQNQLSLLYLIHQFAQEGSQFIISTHSPILMAYPQAQLVELSDEGIRAVQYEEIEHVQLMQNFMKDPKRYMHYLLNEVE